jgi:RNA polymerase sigma-70 factor (ECF subfamily)
MTAAAQALPVGRDETLDLARRGDALAFGALVRRHESMVFSIALHVLRSRSAAEDLAQEVFLQLFRHLPQIESAEHVVAWLRRVTSHRCIDELRRLHHRMELPLDSASDRGVLPRGREVFLERRVHELLARLPPRPRMVMVLRYQEELEPAEIAGVLGMPVNTVKSHLRRATAVLRAGLLKQEQ